ncbi:uncharacterized protein LOC130451580 [Diorhabda sublineata]|uniref:uncharacterized protein LOC130451580 n=1 Tax=Diorhabda sublineata TaxID=1163346 RepID=UPI0024E0C512|nr:uncharacterized protein LOC130451580 [Diorhabda sublineata]
MNIFRKIGCSAKSLRETIVHRQLSQNCIQISEEVRYALENKLPVVALESTIITHGMSFPQNKECALEVENVVRQQGASPATIAIIGGKIKVGLTEREINYLSDTESSEPIKISRRDLSYALSHKRNGGTTVAGTLLVADKLDIPIFATGGVGGVHREAEKTLDVSADLIELGKSSVAVISSGVKSILDISKTLEFLETQGVFVATFGSSNDFPAFYSRKSGLKVPYFVENSEEAAKVIKINRDLGIKSGMLFGVPVPEEFALDPEIMNDVIEQALEEAKQKNIQGKSITPFLLSKISDITGGKSLKSNIALIKNNAKVAAKIAVSLAKLDSLKHDETSSTETDNIYRRPIIIGGSNMDCSATLDTEEIKLDGKMYQTQFMYTAGGVGRNICEAMFKLDCPPNFLTMVGDDFHGIQIKASIPIECSRFVNVNKTKGTANCIIVFDKAGDCKVLMGDMAIHKEITPELILKQEPTIKRAPLVIMDGNLSFETMEEILRIAETQNIPVFYEPTDVAVARKPFKSKHAKAIKFVTPNLNELYEIADSLNIKHKKPSILKDIALLSQEVVNYVDNVIITMGSQGILIARKGLASDSFLQRSTSFTFSARYYPTTSITNLINVSGAGDCFASGFIASLVSNKSEEISISVGFAAAKLALFSQAAVPKYLFDNTHMSWSTPASYVTVI